MEYANVAKICHIFRSDCGSFLSSLVCQYCDAVQSTNVVAFTGQDEQIQQPKEEQIIPPSPPPFEDGAPIDGTAPTDQKGGISIIQINPPNVANFYRYIRITKASVKINNFPLPIPSENETPTEVKDGVVLLERKFAPQFRSAHWGFLSITENVDQVFDRRLSIVGSPWFVVEFLHLTGKVSAGKIVDLHIDGNLLFSVH